MSRKSGAQAGEGKLESRFAALTSGLLARKGQAAPSNSPIADPAEETEAFTPGDALIPRKLAPKDAKNKISVPGLTPLQHAARPIAQPVAQSAALPAQAPLRPAPLPAATPVPPPPALAAANAKAPARSQPERAATIPAPNLVQRPPVQKPPPKGAAQAVPPAKPLTVINERSYEAGYPDNPSAEDIAAMEAEADEVVSYFEQLGSAPAADGEDLFFDDEDPAPVTPPPPALRDPLDELDDEIAALSMASSLSAPGAASSSAPAPWVAARAPKPAPGSPVRAGVSAQLTVREFMRLSLGAVELDLPLEELIAEAIEEYLDARGIDSLGDNEFLEKLAALSAENQRDGA